MTAETLKEQKEQARRIEAILLGLMHPTKYISTYVYADDGVSFCVDDTHGHVLCEAYRPTSAEEIASMSDARIETRLKEMFANTQRILGVFKG